MRAFVELLTERNNIPIQEQQSQAGILFPSVVTESKLNLWHIGDSIPCEGKLILIGVAAEFSVQDLELLDKINERLSNLPGIDERVDVFDVSACKKMSDFESYIPGIGNVYQTPVVGYWEDGEPREKYSGFQAREWLVNRYQLTDSS